MPPRLLGRASFISLVLAAPALSAQPDPDRWREECRQHGAWNRKPTVCTVRETGMRPASGALTVTPGENGGIAIYGWGRDSIAVVAMIQASASSESAAQELADAVRIAAAGQRVQATGPDPVSGAHWSVSFEVYVPRHMDLALEAFNGPLAVEDVSGTLELSARNGPVSLTSVSGNVKARVQNGPLSVELAGTHWEGVGLDAEAVNGPVDLAIPEGYNARLETGTVNGPMDVAFPLTVTIQGHLTHRIQTTLGQGGAPVRVVTRNGPLTIRRAR